MGTRDALSGRGVDDERRAREELHEWIFGAKDARRFTQDSAVLPQVWLAYDAAHGGRVPLLLTPDAGSSAAALAQAIDRACSSAMRKTIQLAYNESYVAVEMTFAELVRVVVPLSAWWAEREWDKIDDLGAWVRDQHDTLLPQLEPSAAPEPGPHGELIWFVGMVGRIALSERAAKGGLRLKDVALAAADVLRKVSTRPASPTPLLWVVNCNRPARTTIQRSRMAIKADTAERLFDVTCRTLAWGIIDVGIDATHPAFRRRRADGTPHEDPFSDEDAGGGTRVRRTYDFTRLRTLMAGDLPPGHEDADAELRHLKQRLARGEAVDWSRLEPLLRVEHSHRPAAEGGYKVPGGEHGTHVAGILAADWRQTDPEMQLRRDVCGVCPDIELYDLRVFDEEQGGYEFPITAALQFVRFLNAHSDLQVIHGVNLSLAIDHDIRNYACGRTPVCDECDRLVSSGVVVVAAAGNEGRAQYTNDDGISEGYRTTSITDPGNAELVLTVGATHRFQPHTYGVSYFSSRGPTGDGRRKPDLVAPGERIEAPVPGERVKVKDGTSQAAPHVSGAAALLMARYEELRAKPGRVKEILCSTATDLGREHYFQGAGMLDVLRAMQAV